MRLVFNQRPTPANKWAGVIAAIPASCHYAIKMRTRVTNVINGGVNSGYGVASGNLSRQSLPEGTAFQYDFGFGGYRALIYPNDGQTLYHIVAGQLNQGWHQLLIIFNHAMTAYVDGRLVFSQLGPQSCGVPIIRVWSATVDFRDILVGQV
jgi:hypothetical protein